MQGSITFAPFTAERIGVALTVLVAAYVLVMLGTYGYYDGYLDHGEPVVAAAAYKLLDGAEVYPAFDSAQFTSNVYGPYTYIANGFFLSVFGGESWSGKLAGLTSIVLSIAIVWFTYRGAGVRMVCLAIIMMCGFVALLVPYSMWNRPDPVLVLVASLSVLMTHKRSSDFKWLTWAAIGAAGGLAFGLKIYGPVFIAPVGLYVAMRDKSLLAVIVMSVVGAVVAIAPFGFAPFPLDNFLSWFSKVAAKPNDAGMVAKALRYGVIFFIPVIVLLVQRITVVRAPTALLRDPVTAYAGLSLIGMAICVTLAAKPGAGMYYLLPFAPLSIDLGLRSIATAQDRNRVRFGWLYGILAAVILVTAVPVQKRYFRALDWERTAAIRDDLHTVMRKYPGKSIQMAIGSSLRGYHNTLQKTDLIYAGNPYTVDFAIMIETSAMGMTVSAPVITSIEACRTDIWLVPKDEAPLSMNGYYGNKVVGEAFRQAFLAHYSRTGSSAYFDVWTCKRAEN